MDGQRIESGKTNADADSTTKTKDKDAKGQLELEKSYYNTASINNNGTNTFDSVRCSAELGDMAAQFKSEIRNNAGSNSDDFFYKYNLSHERINTTSDIFTKADEGDAAAQLELGKYYYSTTSVDNNDTLAFEWIHRSAEQGNMEAQFRLGDLYALGFGIAKSLPESYKWYTKAGIKGYKKALIRIHNLYQEDIKMYCRGQLDSEEEEWASDEFKEKNKIRELFEYRREQNKSLLNGAIEYYTDRFKRYQLSDQNDPFVQLNLAFLYQHGYGVKKGIRWAFEYYTLAAEQGDIDAQYNLGRLYQQHYRKKFNYREAFKWYNKSAQAGHIVAQRCLAYFYLKGLATDINYEMAISWYTKAADAGDSQSQVTLGLLYRKGDGVTRSVSMAARWYTLAARQGNIIAQNCLSQLSQHGLLSGIRLEEDVQEYLTEDSMNSRLCSKLSIDVSKLGDASDFKYLNTLAKHALIGDGPSMYEIGLNYYYGGSGFPQDKDTGIKWIKNAANREHKDAQIMMVDLYKKGDSIEQDYQKMYTWYKTIAKQKDVVAQYHIGTLYKDGLGVRKDPLEASKWFTWAADRENSDAQFNLGMLRLHGSGIKKDKKEAEEFFYKSAHHKNTDACYELGKIYILASTESNQKLEMGLKLLGFAAKHGHEDTQLALGDIYKKGESLEMDLSKCIEYYTMAADSGNKYAQYQLALIYLNRDEINCDYIKAYNLFKQASNKGHTGANMLFQTPVQYDSNINDYNKVIEMFTEVTEKKVDDLAYNIGSIYEHRVMDDSGVDHFDGNYELAQTWYRAASNTDDSRADYRLGITHPFRENFEKNIPAVIYYYNNAMNKENCDAMYRLAVVYLNGYYIIQDPLKAYHLYTKAATMGHEKAIEVLTVLQMDTKHESEVSCLDIKAPKLPVYEKNRINMLERATEEGYTRLYFQLGLIHEHRNDNLNAFKWFCRAADIGITNAYYKLGIMNEEGKGLEQSYEIAADMYQKATENNHKDACFRLGRLYQYGNGVTLDYLKAYSYYKKAAEMGHNLAAKILNITQEAKAQTSEGMEKNFFEFESKEYQDSLTMCKYVAQDGNTELQFKLGFAYENCYTEPDYEEVLKWYSMAAINSHKEAMYHLGLLYENGLGVSQDYQKAIELYQHAHQLGNEDALHRLGTVYHHGKGVGINPEKAIECYTLSAKLGNPNYQCELGRLYEEGELLDKNLLEALKWYTKAYLQGYDSIRSKLYDMYKDKPYENFFLQRLVRNLTIASYNYFSLNDEYIYKHYADINIRLGFMYYFGIGTDKDLEKSLQHIFKPYSDQEKTTATALRFVEYSDYNFDQKMNILKEFGKSEECMDLLSVETLYELGMVFYDGKVQSQRFNYDSQKKVYTIIDKQESNYPNQSVIIKKDYSSALAYLERSSGKRYTKALIQLGMMYYCGDGVQKISDQGDKYFKLIQLGDVESVKRLAVLCHTHDNVKNFPIAFRCYSHLEKILADDSSLSEDDQEEINELVQTGLGLLYEYGDGVERDYQKAIDYYKKAADDNSRIGYLRLGLMYYYGKGVPVYYKKALHLIQKSTLGNIYEKQIPYVYYEENNLQTSNNNDVDYSKRNRIYCTLTKREMYGERWYYQGLMGKHGQGVEKDERKAQECFKSALILGCQRAVNEIKED